ncbi:hypothetical protein AWC02_06205 [Mycolicibacter engbaekii]|uniref:Secreted protein n=1 Tax=Mycolicibacter engbaekii TaxID=188915 RepID=A0A1X1TZ57_9MYCO|nr:hypothetical protein [Mycolicibacter engbaekii]ORV49872.1 hypothetical protein AWC02_06205 [Mycolicibacter engbaekii]
MVRAITALVLTAGGLALSPAPQAEAVPCVHRGRQHVVQHANGNVDADSRWHVLRGEAATCDTGGGAASTEDTWERRQEDIDRERHGW